jgi:hypothetical protein
MARTKQTARILKGSLPPMFGGKAAYLGMNNGAMLVRLEERGAPGESKKRVQPCADTEVKRVQPCADAEAKRVRRCADAECEI